MTDSTPLRDIDTGGNHVGAVLFPVGDPGEQGGEVVCVYRAGGSNSPHAPEGRVVQRRSTDGGDTWGERRTVFDSPYSDVTGDGGVTPAGTLLCFFDQRDHGEAGIDRTVTTGCIRSTDGGQTWDGFAAIDPRGWSRYSTYGALVTVEGENGPELLKPVWGGTEVDHPEGLHHRGETWVVASDDDGRSWEYRGTVRETAPEEAFRNETSITALPDGTVLAIVRWQGTGFEQYHSTDGGESWTRDGVTTIGHTGADVSPFVYVDGDEARFVGAHRTPYHDDRNVQWMSYATAPVREVVDAPDVWRDHVWFVQATEGANLMGYPEVRAVNGRRLVAFSWRNRDEAINLSVTTEAEIRRLVASDDHVRYDGGVDARGVRANGPIRFTSHEPLVRVAAGPEDGWTAVDVSHAVPSGARRALLWVELTPAGDTPARLELRTPTRVDFGAYADSHHLIDAAGGPRGRQGNGEFDAGIQAPAGETAAGKTVECPLGNGALEWRAVEAATCRIDLVGFR